MFYLGLFANCQ